MIPPRIKEALKALQEMQRQKELMSTLLDIRVRELDAALMLATDAGIETARQNLLAQFEAGVDLKIQQTKRIAELENEANG